MATEYNRQYVGARYVPVFFNNPDGSWDWASGFSYEPLTMVKYGTNTYTSKSQVPATVGAPNLNPEYWAQTGDYNGAIINIGNSVSELQSLSFYTSSFETFEEAISSAKEAGIPLKVDSNVTIQSNISNVSIIGGICPKYHSDSNIHITVNSDIIFSNVYLSNVSIQGTGSISFGESIIENCEIRVMVKGLNVCEMRECDISANGTGIIKAIDSKIIHNFIHACNGNGIYLESGYNDNIISENKIEWNNQNGIELYQSTSNVISENIFDRNTLYGIDCKGKNNVISSNIFKRNGYNSEKKANVSLGATDIIFTNNICIKGTLNDDGSGGIVPQYSIYANYVNVGIPNNFTDSNNIITNSMWNSTVNSPTFQYAIKNSLTLGAGESGNIPLKFKPNQYQVTSMRYIIDYRSGTQSLGGASQGLIISYLKYGTTNTSDITGLPNSISGVISIINEEAVLTLTNNYTEELFINIRIQ